MRLLFIAHSFPPVQHSGTLRAQAFAKYLPEFGVSLAIFTADPSSVSNWGVSAAARLDGWRDDERWLEVCRVLWGVAAPGRPMRWLKRLPVGQTVLVRRERQALVRQLLPAVLEAVERHRPDLIFATLQPVETVYLAREAARRCGLPWMADLRDPWSYAASAPYRHYVDFLLERCAERNVLATAAHVLVTTEASRQLLVKHSGVDAKKVTVLPNGFEPESGAAAGDREPLDAGRFVVAHLGELSSVERPDASIRAVLRRRLGLRYDPLQTDNTTRSARWALEAAKRLIEERPELREKLRFWFVGIPDATRFASFREFPYPECIRVMPRVASVEADAIARRADLLLLLQNRYFLNGKDHGVAIAAKTYSYLQTGRPILACLQQSEMADLVRAHGRGVVVRPDDVSQIAAALNQMIDAPDKNVVSTIGSREGLDQYTRRTLTGRLAELLRRVRAEFESDRALSCSAAPAMSIQE